MELEQRTQTVVTEAATAASDAIVAMFAACSEEGMPKHALLRKAVLSCIDSGLLQQGDKLPAEQTLTAALGLSLGTVRRALAQLADGRVLVRSQGRGTFVGERPKAHDDNWHFRFLDPDTGATLPVYSRLIERSLVADSAPYRRALGEDSSGYVRVRRRFDIAGRFFCVSELSLPASRFQRLLELPESALEGVNLKTVLAESFNAPTLYADQTACVEVAPSRVATLLDVAPKTVVMVLRVLGFGFGERPITYQEVWIPPVRERLDLGRIRRAGDALRVNLRPAPVQAVGADQTVGA